MEHNAENNSSGNSENTVSSAIPQTPPPPEQAAPAAGGQGARKKSRGCFWIFLGFAAFCLVIFGASALLGIIISSGFSELKDQDDDEFESYDRKFISGDKASVNTILSIPVTGVIISDSDDSPFTSSAMASAGKICNYLQMAENDPAVKAVIININSPGGEVVASDRIHHAITELRQSGKPVVAVIGSMGTSGGYYIACACDKILAHRLAITGSIGVIIQNYKYYELLKKIGLQSDTYTSCKYKDLLAGDRPEKPGERAIIQKHIDKVYQAFIKIVADGRPDLSVKQLQKSIITDGRIFLGTEALKLKMVDELGFFEDGVKIAAQLAELKDYRVVAYKKKFSLAALFNLKSGADSKNIHIQLPGKNKYLIESGKFYYLPVQ
ncbi:MAG: signal peptide peptidase SppA [Victivallales bacterium]|nr:signal peptide peptidase SppA [Victivallales bacterium]